MFKSLLNRLKNDSKVPHQSADNQSGQNSPANILDTDRIKAIIHELNSSVPVFERAGFVYDALDVHIGLNSKITPYFKQTEIISEQTQEEILATCQSQPLIQFILMSLFRSVKMRPLFQDSGLEFDQVSVEITSEPGVTTRFKRM